MEAINNRSILEPVYQAFERGKITAIGVINKLTLNYFAIKGHFTGENHAALEFLKKRFALLKGEEQLLKGAKIEYSALEALQKCTDPEIVAARKRLNFCWSVYVVPKLNKVAPDELRAPSARKYISAPDDFWAAVNSPEI